MAQQAGPSSSFTRRWTYDVYLNFIGIHTRFGFVGYLYHILDQRGLYPFFDDEELTMGEEIGRTHRRAIQESRTVIVVFSKNYASSRRCLEELVQIMERFKGEGRFVIPVFYGVGTSEVEYQRGRFGEVFDELEQSFRDNEEKVQGWREALCEAAGLPGFHFESGYVYELVKRIVKEVSRLIQTNVTIDDGADGIWNSKLNVSNEEIASGSNGTVVFKGLYQGREVAVKRLVRAHHHVASQEIQNLIKSDGHPNIVRYYGTECDRNFIYLALELCFCTLDDLIQCISENPTSSVDQTLDNMQGFWKANSHLLLKLMRDMVAGLVHLHKLRIIHRDLKPQNVLITKEGEKYLAKLSDMGISKHLQEDKCSLGHNATAGCGTPGWQAPEQLASGRQTLAMDSFGLGCVLFYCITRGGHPFGERLERDGNIMRNEKELSSIEFIPEAKDLILCLLDPNPDQRPTAAKVLLHPFLWSFEKRLSFLCDASDRLEAEDIQNNSDLLEALEGSATVVLDEEWHEKLDPALMTNISAGHISTQNRRKRKHHGGPRYKFGSVQHLLRVIRNKRNHYTQLPPETQELVGSVPNGFYDYFATRFPRLLFELYKILLKHCKGEKYFESYFEFENVD